VTTRFTQRNLLRPGGPPHAPHTARDATPPPRTPFIMPRITRKARTLGNISSYINAVDKFEVAGGGSDSEEEDRMLLEITELDDGERKVTPETEPASDQ
jgi:hypothetical protein